MLKLRRAEQLTPYQVNTGHTPVRLPRGATANTPRPCCAQAARGTDAGRRATAPSSSSLPRRPAQGKACSGPSPRRWTPVSSTRGTQNPSTSTSAPISSRGTACTDGNQWILQADGGNSRSIFLSLGSAKQAGPRCSVTTWPS